MEPRDSRLLAVVLLAGVAAVFAGCDDSSAEMTDADSLSVADGAASSGLYDAAASSSSSAADASSATQRATDAGGSDAESRSDAAAGPVLDASRVSDPRDASVADGSVAADGSSDSAASATTCTPPAAKSSAANPLFTDQYTADPAAFVSGCTFYVQCGHDEAAAGQNGFVMKEWFLLSSIDMVHWTKKVALRLSDFSWADANAWAGQMVTKNGKFYWYVPVNERGHGMAIGVAVADSPTGPFKDALGKPLISDGSEMANFGFSDPGQTVYTIDPTVFVDDDGQAYLHYGGFSRMVVAKLNDDMISINGKLQEVTPPGFFEAPFLTKRNGKYYEIYAAGVNPATIDYATSNTPMGPWTRGGRILDALPKAAGQDAATNHAGVAQFAGQWYIVYHLSNGPNGGGTYRREVAIDKLNFNADGSIQRVAPSPGLSF